MDEINQQTVQMDSEAVPNDFDLESQLKGSADEEVENKLSRKSSNNTSSGESLVEANVLSTNGIDSEFVKTALEVENDNISIEYESKSCQLQENPNQQEEKVPVDNPTDVLNPETIKDNKESFKGESVELSCSSKETEKRINLGVNFSQIPDSQNTSDSNIKNSNKENENTSSEISSSCEVHMEKNIVFEQHIVVSQNSETKCAEKNESDLNESITLPVSENVSVKEGNQESLTNNGKKIVILQSGDTHNKTCTSDIRNKEEYKRNMDVIQKELGQKKEDEKEIMNKKGNSGMDLESDTYNNISDSEKMKKPNDLNADVNIKENSFGSSSDNEKSKINKENLYKNGNVSESSSNGSQQNVNISNESVDQNIIVSEIDGSEVIDTEMINCNEIEQIDINEMESQKDKEVDRIRIETIDTDINSENKEEEIRSDKVEPIKEKSRSNENPSNISMESDTNVKPGFSEGETITGDMPNQSSDSINEKNGEACIIPDDVVPVLSILPQSDQRKKVRNIKGKKEEKLESTSTVLSPVSNKARNKSQAKNREGNETAKQRPVRNAMKVASNKIKSLVENDLNFEKENSDHDSKEGTEIQDNTDDSKKTCTQCREVKVCKFVTTQGESNFYLCSEQCSRAIKEAQMDTEVNEPENVSSEFVRKCSQCHSQIKMVDHRCLFWETMNFCNEDCLGQYQSELGSSCANCKGSVALSSLGKYCVRFGYDIKQFCSSCCLEEYKKGLKVCSYCQKDISTGTEGFLAPVGDKGQFKDFCTQTCMEKYEKMSSNASLPEVIEECAVCSNSKPVRVEVELDNKTHKLCSEPCFAAFKFVNNVTEGQCDMCKKYFNRAKNGNFVLFFDENPHLFCCKTCMNVYILVNRKVVPCNRCKVKKYNFDMIKKVSSNGRLAIMCSLNCLMLYQVSVNVCTKNVKCDFCMATTQPQYSLNMSDTTIRSFCCYNCVIAFQNQFTKKKLDLIPGTDQYDSAIPIGGPKRINPRRSQVEAPCVPVISAVHSLAPPTEPTSPPGKIPVNKADVNMVTQVTQPHTIPTTATSIPAPPQVYQQIITKPPPAKQMKNKSVLCKPYSHTKGVSCRPHPCMKETQTDQSLNRKFLIPIPVPIYVPAPMHMFATPFPVPVPFPLPIPVPIFIPTTRNSAKGIFKEIKKIQEKIPTDPFEAELLMMAEMVAGEKKQDPTDSESEDGNDGDDGGDGTFSPENVDTSNTFGDDMLQMALKMASELEEPAVDMESVLTSNTITTSAQPSVDPNKALYGADPDNSNHVHVMSMNRGRKRSVRGSRNSVGGTPSKRGRRTSGSVDVPLLPPPEPVPPPRIEVEKPDANMCLKYTFGVNAWRHWVMQKNAELEKAAMTNRKIKLFKPELLQLTADELNFSLCLFVKEVRKPNGTEYAPDTIYYLCLGIQQYLFENGRIDNIFTDSYYEKFTDCLDEVAKKFAALYNDSQYIVTRVEEEHLWESKQLGAHSPHVLLSTLMFFNTKHFNLVTVEEHMQLSFSHIMKHWKRNPNTPGVAKVPGSRNVLLRFYPPQSALEANSRKKKVYEQQENEENPLRCPVKLYEFYLSKCPESVKTRNDVFYLLPERSCVPDSPVWYSTMALGKEPLMKMLHRVKMVKEINMALLTC